MTRRFLLLAALAAVFASGPAAAATTTLKLATLVPEGSLWDKELRTMAAEVQKRTQGRVVLRIYPGGTAGDEPDVVRKMRIGQLQGGMLTASGLIDIDDGFSVFTVPRFITSYPELFHVVDSLTPALSARLDKEGFVLLGWGHAGWIHLFSRKPVHVPADVKGQKLYVSAGENDMVQWWKARGYQPVPLAATDIMTGLQTGMIDALPSPPLAALTFQWYRPTPYMLDLGLAPLVGATVVSKRAWGTISPADQAVIRQLAQQMGDRLEQAIPEQDRKSIEEMTRRGMTVTKPKDAAQQKAWDDAAADFATSMRASMVPQEVFDAAKAARDAFRARPQ
jgi:TRAP-type C4-dicarboxylate transport system substrate-binding protein